MILLFFFSFFVSNAELEKQKQEVIIKKNLKRGNTIFSLNYIINYMTIYTDQKQSKILSKCNSWQSREYVLDKDAV